MYAPLPVGDRGPGRVLRRRPRRDGATSSSPGQAVGAQVLTELTGFAPPTIMSQAARLQARQRFFNLVVTNVPGPQIPLYMLGRELHGHLPDGAARPAPGLGIAIMSYNGRLNFGLLGDYDALPDLEGLGERPRRGDRRAGHAAGAGAALEAATATAARAGIEMPSGRGGGGRARPSRAAATGGARRRAPPARRAVGASSPSSSRGRRRSRCCCSSSPATTRPSTRRQQPGHGAGPGVPRPGRAHLRAGAAGAEYNSDPPTSGPHVAEAIRRDGACSTDDQVLHALELGNVVLVYGSRSRPPGCEASPRTSAAAFDPRWCRPARRSSWPPPGTDGVVALAWRAPPARRRRPADPELQRFAESWLGRGRQG